MVTKQREQHKFKGKRKKNIAREKYISRNVVDIVPTKQFDLNCIYKYMVQLISCLFENKGECSTSTAQTSGFLIFSDCMPFDHISLFLCTHL